MLGFGRIGFLFGSSALGFLSRISGFEDVAWIRITISFRLKILGRQFELDTWPWALPRCVPRTCVGLYVLMRPHCAFGLLESMLESPPLITPPIVTTS